MHRFVVFLTLTASAAVALAVSSTAQRPVFAPVPDQQRLHNGHVVTDKIISGAQPEGDASFEALRELGVKTIVSVDGAKPDVTRAKHFGMRYVHFPIGYDGVSEDEGKAIAKALIELPGPVYVHCHHGKHRSAAAVAVACVYNGMLPPRRAADVLRTFGTGENYKGLWRDARAARPVDPSELSALNVDYVETAKIPDVADAMVKVEFHWDHMKDIQKAGWRSPADHPDLDPAHEALQIQEHFTEIGRMEQAKARPAEYRLLLSEAERGATELRETLSAASISRQKADAAFKSVAASCTACHSSYRD